MCSAAARWCSPRSRRTKPLRYGRPRADATGEGFPSAPQIARRPSIGAITRRKRRMHQLPGLDASFLHLETPQMPMHVGALHHFELPADYRGDFLADMRRHIAARLVLAPALRQKLVKMPLNLSNPVWV